jgi:hypothetical protein
MKSLDNIDFTHIGPDWSQDEDLNGDGPSDGGGADNQPSSQPPRYVSRQETVVLWIRIRIGSGFSGVPGSGSGSGFSQSGSRGAKTAHKHRKKLIISVFEVLDVLF